MIDTNRKGRYLRYLIDGGDVTELPKPFSDIECYLYGLCIKKSEGGDKGPKGDKGDPGPQGPQGPKGDPGEQGRKRRCRRTGPGRNGRHQCNDYQCDGDRGQYHFRRADVHRYSRRYGIRPHFRIRFQGNQGSNRRAGGGRFGRRSRGER